MSTREVERELAAVLHRRAEDAMNSTNTHEEHQKFLKVVDGQERSNRRRWVVGGVAAAVAAAAAGIALWSSDLGDDRTEPPPANAPDSNVVDSAGADLEVAEGLAAVFAAHDVDGAAPFLAPGTDAPWPEWDVHLPRDAAWNIEYLMEPCVQTNTNAVATSFACPYEMHLLGSDEVGKGPFPDNYLEVSVGDGGVVSADNIIPYETNGVGKHLSSVDAWLQDNHPKDASFLFRDEVEISPAAWPRYTRLWEQYVAEYVEVTNAAD